MKQFIIVICMLAGMQALAQENTDSLAPYQRFPAVPPFKLVTVPDSASFEKADLKKKKAVMIIYFSPDCDHCIHFTKELLSQQALFHNVQIVMASTLPYDIIKKFYVEYKVGDHPNIHMGRDKVDFFRTFYAVRNFPTIVLYDKKGNFVKRFDGAVKIGDIAAEL